MYQIFKEGKRIGSPFGTKRAATAYCKKNNITNYKISNLDTAFKEVYKKAAESGKVVNRTQINHIIKKTAK